MLALPRISKIPNRENARQTTSFNHDSRLQSSQCLGVVFSALGLQDGRVFRPHPLSLMGRSLRTMSSSISVALPYHCVFIGLLRSRCLSYLPASSSTTLPRPESQARSFLASAFQISGAIPTLTRTVAVSCRTRKICRIAPSCQQTLTDKRHTFQIDPSIPSFVLIQSLLPIHHQRLGPLYGLRSRL
jgi:hypothetical protein